MAYVLTDESNYEDIADAIREKTESSDTYTPGEMAAAIRSIQTGGDVTGVKGNAESEYRSGDVNLTPANIGAKALQAAVASPSASGTAIEFIDTISQDAQGVITPTKKTVRTATENQSGLMSATDKAKLNGIESGAQVNTITGIKGDAEAAYRTGNVNLTPEDIGSPSLDDFADSEAKRMAMYPTGTLTGPVAAFPDGAEDVPVKALTVDISPVQTGSGAPSPSNVRPISGWTGASIKRCGKNLLKLRDTLAPVTIQGVAWQLNDDGSISASRVSTSSSNSDWSIAVLTLPAGQYVYSGVQSGTGGGSTYQSNIRIGDTSHWGANPYSFTLTEPTQIEVVLRYYPGYSGDAVFYPMVRLNSQSDEFEAYQGAVYAFTFPAEAGTVYGGTLDVINGVLTVDRVMLTLDGSETWSMNGSNESGFICNAPVPISKLSANSYTSNIVSNMFTIVGNSSVANPSTTTTGIPSGGGSPLLVYFYLRYDFMADIEAWKTWLATHNAQVSYLIEPNPYQLDPVEVRTLLGANTIYADHGDVSVTYRADPTLQHDNLDGGDVRYIPYLGVYGNNTVGKALRDMEDTIVNMNNDIGSLQGAILGDKLLVFNQDGTVSWEEAPV